MIDEKQIRDWLAEEGLFKEKIPDDTANFHFIINYPEGHIMDIIQPKEKIDMILIGCATEVDSEQISAIRASSESKKQAFIWELRLSLNQFLLDFELEHPNDELHRFVITEEIYEDGLNKNYLILALKKVFKGKLQCIWLLGKNFGEIDPHSVEDTNSMFG